MVGYDYIYTDPFEKKCCYDCGHLKSALSWWCGCKDACDYRGTNMPGVIHCAYWIPDMSYIPYNKGKRTYIDEALDDAFMQIWQEFDSIVPDSMIGLVFGDGTSCTVAVNVKYKR